MPVRFILPRGKFGFTFTESGSFRISSSRCVSVWRTIHYTMMEDVAAGYAREQGLPLKSLHYLFEISCS